MVEQLNNKMEAKMGTMEAKMQTKLSSIEQLLLQLVKKGDR